MFPLSTVLLPMLFSHVQSWTHDVGRDYIHRPHNPDWFDNVISFPTECYTDWTLVRAHEIKCPSLSSINLDDKLSFKLGTVMHPLPNNKYTVDGYICHKQQWISKCEETWYFSTTETNSIENLPIGATECMEAITVYESGEYNNPFFPPFYCSWCSTQIDQKTFIVIEEHTAQENIYNASYIDPMFVGGKCSSNLCKTIHPDVLWVAKREEIRRDACNRKTWETGDVYGLVEEKKFDNDQRDFGIGEQWIRSSIYGVRRLDGSCYSKICGQFGIRFNTGEWWGLDGQGVKIWLRKILKPCQGGLRISFHHDNHDETMAIAHSVAREVTCEEVTGRILNQGFISAFDLAYLNPLNPGRGNVYRVFKRVIKGRHADEQYEYKMEKKYCMYRTLHNVSDVINQTRGKFLLGYFFDGSPFYLNQSDFEGAGKYGNERNTSRDGWFLLTYAGLTKFQQTLYTNEGVSNSQAALRNLHDPGRLALAEETEIPNVRDQMDLANKVYNSWFKMNTTSVGERITTFINNAKSAVSNYFSQLTNVIWWVGTGAIGLIVVILGRRFYRYRKSSKPPALPKRLDSVETQSTHIYEPVRSPQPVARGNQGHPFFSF
ncbi:glycoprotein [Mosqueiro virus]|uniref:Glycoprotein n=1 Tax=Mosqueiro virus TaxID=200403 RepID=A0A0D3R1L8_9RHAB|nr:glycoprotein [Mosqueiro virus]AJR28516.1 glycoprotein [Mosqueiro virus]